MENSLLFQKNVSAGAIEVCKVLQNAGHDAYIVGGCVRDLALGVEPKDWDIATNASPTTVQNLFEKTYPTGIQHGTITVVLDEQHFEVTTFRIEGKYEDGRRPEEVFFVMNIEQDLARRDLTINAMAYDPVSETLIDPYGGMNDLENKLIRAVGDPKRRFEEDGLRIMRVARFAARFNYYIDDTTLKGMLFSIKTLEKVSKERIKDELCKTLMSKYPSYGLNVLKDAGVFDLISICLKRDSLSFTKFIGIIDKCNGDLETKLALLYGSHDNKATIARELKNLKFSNNEQKKIMFLIDMMDEFIKFGKNRTEISYKTFIAWAKNNCPIPYEKALKQFVILIEATGIQIDKIFARYGHLQVPARKELKINGDDLLALGFKPGKEIKKVLDDCYLEIIRNPKNNNEGFLLSFASGNWNLNKTYMLN